MKNILPLILSLLLASCGRNEKPEAEKVIYENEKKDPAALGQELFEGEGNCFACHKPDQKIIAPSIKEIAKIYREKNGDIVKFLKEEGGPIVDPSQYEVMKTNFAITKNMTDDELKAIEAYMHSIK
ncbi:MAG TPA: c-type cytochrome [Flavobacterium sp.]|jgi:cytochrome c